MKNNEASEEDEEVIDAIKKLFICVSGTRSYFLEQLHNDSSLQKRRSHRLITNSLKKKFDFCQVREWLLLWIQNK